MTRLAETPSTLQDQLACIEALDQCASACENSVLTCLQSSYAIEKEHLLTLNRDCGQFCRLLASFFARGSDFALQLCNSCADICSACAEECSHFGEKNFEQCAVECSRCEMVCREMAAFLQPQPSAPQRPSKPH